MRINLNEEFPEILIVVKDHYFLRRLERKAKREDISSNLMEQIQEWRLGTQEIISELVTDKFKLDYRKSYVLYRENDSYIFEQDDERGR